MSDKIDISVKTARAIVESTGNLPPNFHVVDDEGNTVDIVAVNVATKAAKEIGGKDAAPPQAEDEKSFGTSDVRRKNAAWKNLYENMQRKTITTFSSIRDQGQSTNNMSGIADAFADIFGKVYESQVIQRLFRVNMSSPVVRIPELIFSGTPGVTVEGEGKPTLVGDTRIVKLEATTYASHIPVTNQLLEDMAAFQSIIPTMASGDIRNQLDGAAVTALTGATARVHVPADDDVSGHVSAADLYNMRAKMWPMNPANGVILANPAQWTRINLLDKEVRASAEGPWNTFLGMPVLLAPQLPAATNASHSGSVVMADLNWLYFGVRGDLTEEFNPYYGWDQNISDIRVEGRFDIKPATSLRWSTTFGFTSGYTMSPYVILAAGADPA